MAHELLSVARKTKYPPAAFQFVERGLSFTVERVHGEVSEEEVEAAVDDPQVMASRHVTGAQLCHGLRDFAIEQYGLLARTVLKRWGITRCEDFGRIVFAMVECDMMQKTDGDTLADFQNVFQFHEAFDETLTLDSIAQP